jgi:Fe-S oxidoreductase
VRVGLMIPYYIDLKVKGLSFADFNRPDECCGFGGTAGSDRDDSCSGYRQVR